MSIFHNPYVKRSKLFQHTDYGFLTKEPVHWLFGAGACLQTDGVLLALLNRQSTEFRDVLENYLLMARGGSPFAAAKW